MRKKMQKLLPVISIDTRKCSRRPAKLNKMNGTVTKSDKSEASFYEPYVNNHKQCEIDIWGQC